MTRPNYLLALVLLFFCTPVLAQEFINQRFLMPGEVIQGHAKFEDDCQKCHISSERNDLPRLCLDCHDEIAEDRRSKKGFHGQGPLSSTKACNTCHTDHLGRNADIINMQIDAFNHEWTRFALEGKHASLECNGCHQKDEKYRDAEPVCATCHEEDDFHKGALGDQCDTCHTPASWQKRKAFDHSTTGFNLLGSHQEVACIGCHANQVYKFESQQCVDCHRAADPHAGKNGDKCDTCHSVQSWDRVDFDHNTTQFPLRFNHAEIPCRACHENGVVDTAQSSECYSCHVTDDVHLGRNGKQCQDCHQISGWEELTFNHFQKSEFPLDGKHQELACTQCHSSNLHEELPRDCASCHQADDPHKKQDMQVCATCHSPESWRTTSLFDHQITGFPLVGMHQIVACQNCHMGNQFSGTDPECISCHKADDPHRGSLGTECHSCHSPNSWSIWQFDHDLVTNFALTGSHKELACESCHKPNTEPADTTMLCGNCHAQQDIHDGEFGKNCGRCHNTEKFFELNFQDLKR